MPYYGREQPIEGDEKLSILEQLRALSTKDVGRGIDRLGRGLTDVLGSLGDPMSPETAEMARTALMGRRPSPGAKSQEEIIKQQIAPKAPLTQEEYEGSLDPELAKNPREFLKKAGVLPKDEDEYEKWDGNPNRRTKVGAFGAGVRDPYRGGGSWWDVNLGGFGRGFGDSTGYLSKYDDKRRAEDKDYAKEQKADRRYEEGLRLDREREDRLRGYQISDREWALKNGKGKGHDWAAEKAYYGALDYKTQEIAGSDLNKDDKQRALRDSKKQTAWQYYNRSIDAKGYIDNLANEGLMNIEFLNTARGRQSIKEGPLRKYMREDDYIPFNGRKMSPEEQEAWIDDYIKRVGQDFMGEFGRLFQKK